MQPNLNIETKDYFEVVDNLFSGGLYCFMSSFNISSGIFNQAANDFIGPSISLFNNFIESESGTNRDLEERLNLFLKFGRTMNELSFKGFNGAFESYMEFLEEIISGSSDSLSNTFSQNNGENFKEYWNKLEKASNNLTFNLPQLAKDMYKKLGPQVQVGDQKITETPRYELWKLNSPDKGKPVLGIGPEILTSKIMHICPSKGFSLLGEFAKTSPTYFTIRKGFENNPVQEMTINEAVLDLEELIDIIHKKHNQKISLQSGCQAGLLTTLALLETDIGEKVDNVAFYNSPLMGHNDSNFQEHIKRMPTEYRDTKYARLDGRGINAELMSQAYMYLNIQTDNFVSKYLKYLSGLIRNNGEIKPLDIIVSSWLSGRELYENHLTNAWTDMSNKFYKPGISEDGKMPVALSNDKKNIVDLLGMDIIYSLVACQKDNIVHPYAVSSFTDLLFSLDSKRAKDKVHFSMVPGGHGRPFFSPNFIKEINDGVPGPFIIHENLKVN